MAATVSLLDALRLVATATLAVGWVVVAVNAISFPRLGRRRVGRGSSRTAADRGTTRARVSLLVPARDEAARLTRTLPGMLAQGADEVVVLDDGSSDGTAEVVGAHALAGAGLRLVRGRSLPDGWIGKNWACHQLALRATGDLLLFTDADVLWSPGALDALLELQRAHGAGLTSVWPRQVCGSVGERALVPAMVDAVLLACLPAPLAMRAGAPSLSAGCGQCMLWTREAYAAAGGHAAVRGQVLEDVHLARRAKAAGVRLVLGLGGDLLAVRMYESYGDAVRGFGKNVLAAVGGSGPALVSVWLVALVTYTLPWALAPFDLRWLALGVAGVALRAAVNAVSGRRVGEALLQPVAPLAAAPAVALALRWGRAVSWRGRRYGA